LEKYNIYLRDKDDPLTVEVGKSYLIEVKGWIMCKDVDAGQYRMVITKYHNYFVGDLYKPRGNKLIVRHMLDELMFMSNECTDNNGTIIIKELE